MVCYGLHDRVKMQYLRFWTEQMQTAVFDHLQTTLCTKVTF